MNNSELTKRVKQLVLANNLDYAGVAPVEALQNEPEGQKPGDFLPGARSVVVIGVRFSIGAQLANKLAYKHYRHSVCTYLWHGFGLPNLHYLDPAALLVTRLLEDAGHIAVPLSAISPFDPRTSLSEFSHIHAAVAAGLGEIGWSGQLLTPDAGPRARFCSIITTAKLKPDAVYSGPELCNITKCAAANQGEPVCMKVCPVGALKAGNQKIVIGDKRFETAEFDRYKCFWASMGLSDRSLGLKSIPMPEKVGIANVFDALKQRDPRQSKELMVINKADYCGQCVIQCPVGNPKITDEIVSKVITHPIV